MLEIHITNTFKKDAKKSKKQQLDLKILENIIDLLKTGQKLPSKYRDHNLVGNYKNCRECHLKPDWLLIYEVINNRLILHRLGSHSELF